MKKGLLRYAVPVLVVAALALLWHCRDRIGGGEPPGLRATGVIEGTEVNLSAKVAGRIASIAANEGDNVAAGAAAVVLDAEDVKASVARAEAGVEQAKASLLVASANIASARGALQSAASDEKGAAADLSSARIRVEERRKEAERRRSLYDKQLIAMELRDQAVAEARVAEAGASSAEERVNTARSRKDAAAAQLRSAESQLVLARAQVREAEADLAFSRSKLADTVVRSPIAGTVVLKALEAGETVSPGTTILTLVDMASLYAHADVDETRISGVVLGGRALVSPGGSPGRVFEGRVAAVGPRAEFATQRDVVRGREDIKTFRVKVKVDDPSGTLKPGMTVEVAFPGPSPPPGR